MKSSFLYVHFGGQLSTLQRILVQLCTEDMFVS